MSRNSSTWERRDQRGLGWLGFLPSDHPGGPVQIHDHAAPIAQNKSITGPLPSAPALIAFDTTLSTFSM